MSQDGLNWARIEGEHHTGALLDVGDPGEWDELFVAAPQVGASVPSVCVHLSNCHIPETYLAWNDKRKPFETSTVLSPMNLQAIAFDSSHATT